MESSGFDSPISVAVMAENRTVSAPVVILLAAGTVAVILVALILVSRTASGPSAPKSALSDEQKIYLGKIVVSSVRMSAAENFLGGTVTYLNARVTNSGTRLVRRVDLELNFVDTLNQVVLNETARPITSRTPPLKPGETRAFQVTFEHMPVDWNLAPPTVRPTYVEF